MGTVAIEGMKRGQFVLVQIPEFAKGFALGVVEGVKKDDGYVVKILHPVIEEREVRDVVSDDVMPADCEPIFAAYAGRPLPFKITPEGNALFLEELSRHERGQQREMEAAFDICPHLPESASVADGIKALIRAGHRGEATELLFGCRRGTAGHKLTEGLSPGWSIYMEFLAGQRIPSELFGRIADRHRWIDNPNNVPVDSGYPIWVFEGEFLLIMEQEATQLLHILLPSTRR